MTIQEMHNEFRTFGQVMGLQLVRGILPESIDVYLNAAINETVRNIISKNVANSLQVGILPQAASITPINALRTLSSSQLTASGSSHAGSFTRAFTPSCPR